jgi:hypothetical protein
MQAQYMQESPGFTGDLENHADGIRITIVCQCITSPLLPPWRGVNTGVNQL